MHRSARTAIARKTASAPLRHFMKRFPTIFQDAQRILDFGCGYGIDVKAMLKANLPAQGYDPNQSGYQILPSGSFDLVLITYVLNVLESHEERLNALRHLRLMTGDQFKIFATTRSKKEIQQQSTKNGWKPYSDGFLTGKDTFQKGFDHETLWSLLQEGLDLPLEGIFVPLPVSGTAILATTKSR